MRRNMKTEAVAIPHYITHTLIKTSWRGFRMYLRLVPLSRSLTEDDVQIGYVETASDHWKPGDLVNVVLERIEP